jgi:hypothetical protein
LTQAQLSRASAWRWLRASSWSLWGFVQVPPEQLAEKLGIEVVAGDPTGR